MLQTARHLIKPLLGVGTVYPLLAGILPYVVPSTPELRFFFFLERATLKKKKKESVRTNIIQPGFRIAEGHKKRREKFAVTKLLMLFTKSLFEIGVTRANGEPIFFLIFLHSRRTHCQCYQTLTNQYSDSQKFFHLRNPTFFFSFPFSSESNKARIVSYTKSNPAISSCFD